MRGGVGGGHGGGALSSALTAREPDGPQVRRDLCRRRPRFSFFLGSRTRRRNLIWPRGEGRPEGGVSGWRVNQGLPRRAAREGLFVFCLFSFFLPVFHSPEELAESLVVGDGLVVVLGEAVLDVLQAPLLHQLAGGLGLLGGERRDVELLYCGGFGEGLSVEKLLFFGISLGFKGASVRGLAAPTGEKV